MFKELILWGDVNEIAVNPPTIVVEVFDKDIGVSSELSSICWTAFEISGQWKKKKQIKEYQGEQVYGLNWGLSLCFQVFCFQSKTDFHSKRCFLVNSEHVSKEYFWAPKKLEWD